MGPMWAMNAPTRGIVQKGCFKGFHGSCLFVAVTWLSSAGMAALST